MLWSRFAYCFDFFITPVLAMYFVYHAWHDAAGWGQLTAALWLVNGIVAWTFIEYLVHRFVFHHAPVFRPAHMAHHDAPDELIASPPAIVPIALALFTQLLMCGASPAGSAAFSAGVQVGYLFYSFVHWATHQVRNPRFAYLIRAKRRHLQHHYKGREANYGVTTDIWDRAFATVLSAKVSRL